MRLRRKRSKMSQKNTKEEEDNGMKKFIAWCAAGWLLAFGAQAQEAVLQGGVNPGYHEPPAWFKQSFLDLRDDVAEAAAANKRVLLYFYQDGCPYCQKLLEHNFGIPAIAEKTQRNYDVVAINIWGDREVTDMDGTALTEKRFAERHKVMFTPTLLFLDERGGTVLRVNGYYAPAKFDLALDYGMRRDADKLSFRDYLARQRPAAARATLQTEPFFLKPPYALARHRAPAQRPLLVLFEQRDCDACDEFHRDVLARPQTRELLARFDVAQLDMWDDTAVMAPDGAETTAVDWARRLKVQYAPTLVFFDERGQEVFRAEAYLKSFHVQSVLDYVASGAYKTQPNLQRFIQERADRLREQGVQVDLMD